jgi:diacylglycerol O-acyltransferase / wax synthase
VSVPEPLSSREMDAVDALLLRGDDDPAARSTMLGLFILDDAPDWPGVVAAFDRASRTAPRLRQRVMAPSVPISLPYWIFDPDFDLGYHVRRLRLAGSRTLRELLDLAQVQGTVPLDRSRPLWEATLVEGLDPETCSGRAALMIKTSHAVGDGIAGIAMALSLFEFERDPGSTPLQAPPAADDVTPGDLVRLRVQQLPSELVDRSVDNLRCAAQAMTAVVRRPGDTATSAIDTVRTTIQWTRSLSRTLTRSAEPSPAWQGRGQRRRYSVLEVALADLRQAGRAAGGSVNDAYLASVLAGIRRYHEKSGQPIDEIAMAVPVSLRTDNDPSSGNRFAGARFAGPAGEEDPVVRIRRIRELVTASRAEPALDALRTFAPIFARLPTAAIAGLRGRVMTHDVQVSNVPGYPVPVYFAGQRILRLYPFGPVPGVAAMIVLVSHVGVCYVGVNVDPDAVRDPELFDACLQEGFAEVLALADAGRPDAGSGHDLWNQPANSV